MSSSTMFPLSSRLSRLLLLCPVNTLTSRALTSLSLSCTSCEVSLLHSPLSQLSCTETPSVQMNPSNFFDENCLAKDLKIYEKGLERT